MYLIFKPSKDKKGVENIRLNDALPQATGAGMTVNGKNGNYQLWTLEYTHQYHDYKTLQIQQETYTAEGGYSFFLLGDARKNVTLNFGITGVVGYESINRGEAILDEGVKILSEDIFVYGTGGRLTFEMYLSDRFVLVL